MSVRERQITAESFSTPEDGFRMVITVEPEQRAVTIYRSRENICILTAAAADIIEGFDVVP